MEFCGKADTHDYELFLALNDIDHSKTKVKNPQSNGILNGFIKPLWMSSTALHFGRRSI